MLIFTTRFSKKKAVLTVIVIGAVIAALVILAGHFQKGGNADLPQLTDNPQRVAYLQSLGWEIETEPLETLQFLLPATLTEPYLSYNQLQKEHAAGDIGQLGEVIFRCRGGTVGENHTARHRSGELRPRRAVLAGIVIVVV